MRFNWNFARLAMLAFLTLWAAGCSGVNAGGNVSPATFFLPGVMKADPPPPAVPASVAMAAPPIQIALAR